MEREFGRSNDGDLPRRAVRLESLTYMDETLRHAHAIYVFALERREEPLGASIRPNPLLRWAAAGGKRLGKLLSPANDSP